MALAFVRQRPFTTSVLMAASRAGQLEANLAAIDLVLPKDLLKAIDAIHDAQPNPLQLRSARGSRDSPETKLRRSILSESTAAEACPRANIFSQIHFDSCARREWPETRASPHRTSSSGLQDRVPANC